jgi:hypothetical protein
VGSVPELSIENPDNRQRKFPFVKSTEIFQSMRARLDSGEKDGRMTTMKAKKTAKKATKKKPAKKKTK